MDTDTINRGKKQQPVVVIDEANDLLRNQFTILVSAISMYLYLVYWEKYDVNTEHFALLNKVSAISENKPYADFESFFPFYLTQHSDLTSRRLHFLGTTISLGIVCSDINVFMAIVPSLTFSLAICHVTRHYDYGHIEALVALGFFLSQLLRAKKMYKGLLAILVGYGFAWIGHFAFEKNQPATFVYPTYSLFGDFKLWFSIASRQIPF